MKWIPYRIDNDEERWAERSQIEVCDLTAWRKMCEYAPL